MSLSERAMDSESSCDAFSTRRGRDEKSAFLAAILQSIHRELVAMHSAQSATVGASTAHPRGERDDTAIVPFK